MEMTVMDFSGIYEREPWMRERKERWISFRGLPGTDGYCTDEAAAEIRRRIAETHARGIHFLDSGNYHYLTKFWIEKIREPFELIVFDRHSDMQPSALLPLTSCGNWLLEALEEQPLLRRVWLIGPAEETIENVPAKYRGTEAAGRVVCVCDREACSMPPCREDGEDAYPVYLSIDKDVLRKEDAPTNWDQGILTTELLLGWLDVICQTREVLGADICGEPAESGLQAGTDQECRKNDEVNRRLAEFLADRLERMKNKEERTERAMTFEKENLVQDAMEFGFSHAGLAKIETLKPMIEVRDMCAVDKCHAYDRTWTCPPGCGTIEECAERMKQYDWGILLQTTAELEDSLDYEGMQEGQERQKEHCMAFLKELRKVYKDILPLCSAGCDICKTCTYPDAPCRFPEKALSAMEGYGLLVSQVCQDNDLKYYYGPNTVTYTALFLIKEHS